MNGRKGTIGGIAVVAALLLSSTAAAQEAAPVEVNITMLEILRDGGIIGHFILVVSVIALGLTIDNALVLRRRQLCPPDTVDDIEGLLEKGDVREAAERCAKESNLFTNIVAAGLAKVGHDFAVIEKALEEATEEESVKLHTRIGWISFICSAATLLGLLGTIQGMIVAFKTIAALEGQASPATLSGGISAALITTLYGLMIAIPFSFVFVLFRNRVITTTIEVGRIVEDLFERYRDGRRS